MHVPVCPSVLLTFYVWTLSSEINELIDLFYLNLFHITNNRPHNGSCPSIHLSVCLSVCLCVSYRLLTHKLKSVETRIDVNLYEDRNNWCANFHLKRSKTKVTLHQKPRENDAHLTLVFTSQPTKKLKTCIALHGISELRSAPAIWDHTVLPATRHR